MAAVEVLEPGSFRTTSTELWPCTGCGRPLNTPGACTTCEPPPIVVVRFRPCATCGTPSTSKWCSPGCHVADEGPPSRFDIEGTYDRPEPDRW